MQYELPEIIRNYLDELVIDLSEFEESVANRIVDRIEDHRNRLERLTALNAPQVILDNETAMLQKASANVEQSLTDQFVADIIARIRSEIGDETNLPSLEKRIALGGFDEMAVSPLLNDKMIVVDKLLHLTANWIAWALVLDDSLAHVLSDREVARLSAIEEIHSYAQNIEEEATEPNSMDIDKITEKYLADMDWLKGDDGWYDGVRIMIEDAIETRLIRAWNTTPPSA